MSSCLGGGQASVAGLAGTGDLYVTCQAGRNCRLGRLLGLGLTYSQAKAKHMAAETIKGAELALRNSNPAGVSTARLQG
jgi:glycerol-3-phosphate dehydrogenase (NAD(P)+)